MLNIENNPWLGLVSYTETDAKMFFGRGHEVDYLCDVIKSNYCTVMYGRSGMGKTSLINAGLIPRLQANYYLPISIKLEHNSKYDYADQIIDSVKKKLDDTQGDIETLDVNFSEISCISRLWLFLHTNIFWSKENRRIVPVVFIDQFEEIFTLSEDKSKIAYFFNMLDELFQPLPPDEILNLVDETETRIDFTENTNFRLILSMREDFLARLEDYSRNIPALKKNRVGIAPLNGNQALEVIMKPHMGIIDRTAALKIIEKVAKRNNLEDDPDLLNEIYVETFILSLFCTQLYKKAAERKSDIIGLELIIELGDNIINDYYKESIKGISKESITFLEDRLLTNSGYRNSLAYEDVVPQYVLKEEIAQLEKSRLIRKEVINYTERIEFTHDVLCAVAIEHKCQRLTKQQRNVNIRGYMSLAIEIALFLSNFALLLFAHGKNFLLSICICALMLITMFMRINVTIRKRNSVLYSLIVFLISYLTSCVPAIYLSSRSIVSEDFPVLMAALYNIWAISWLCGSFKGKRRIGFAEMMKLHKLFNETDKVSRVLLCVIFPSLLYITLIICSGLHMTNKMTIALLVVLPVIFCAMMFRDRLYKDRSILITSIVSSLCVLLLYYNQYTTLRISYLLALVLLYSTYRLVCVKNAEYSKFKKLYVTVFIWFGLFILAPSAIMGYNIWGLGDKSLVEYGKVAGTNHGRFLIVKNRDGAVGAVDRLALPLLPFVFSEIDATAKLEQKSLVFNADDKDVSTSEYLHFKNTYTENFRIYFEDNLRTDLLSQINIAVENNNRLESDTTCLSTDIKRTDFEDLRNSADALITVDYKNYISLASYYSDIDQKKSFDLLNSALKYYLAYNETQNFLSRSNWVSDKSSVLSIIAYTLIYLKTGYISSYINDKFNQYLVNSKDFQNYIKELLIEDHTVSFIEYVYDNSLYVDKISDLILHEKSFFAVRNNDFNKFLKNIYKTSEINQAFALIYMGEYEEAKRLSEHTIANTEDEIDKALASTNLVSALMFLKQYDSAYEIIKQHNGITIYSQFWRDYLYDDFQSFENYGFASEIPRIRYNRFKNLIWPKEKYTIINKNNYNTYWAVTDIDYNPLNVPLRLNGAGKIFLIDKEGNRLSDTFDDVYADDLHFNVDEVSHMPIVIYRKGDLRGFYDVMNNKYVTPALYEHAFAFSDGLAAVVKDNKVGWIDATGELVIPFMFDYVAGFDYVFHGEFARIYSMKYLDDKSFVYTAGLIDKKGNVVLQPIYENVSDESNGLFVVRIGKRQGVVDKHGNELYWAPEGVDVIMDDGTYFVVDTRRNLSRGIKSGRYSSIDSPLEFKILNDGTVESYRYGYYMTECAFVSDSDTKYIVEYSENRRFCGKVVDVTDSSFVLQKIGDTSSSIETFTYTRK